MSVVISVSFGPSTDFSKTAGLPTDSIVDNEKKNINHEKNDKNKT